MPVDVKQQRSVPFSQVTPEACIEMQVKKVFCCGQLKWILLQAENFGYSPDAAHIWRYNPWESLAEPPFDQN